MPISIPSTKDSLIFCPSQYFISLVCITTVKLFSDQTNVHTDDAAENENNSVQQKKNPRRIGEQGSKERKQKTLAIH